MTNLVYNEKRSVLLPAGEQLTVVCGPVSHAQISRKALSAGEQDLNQRDMVSNETKTFGPLQYDQIFEINCKLGTLSYTHTRVGADDVTNLTTLLGTVTQPTSGSISLNVTRSGFSYKMDFTLDRARIPVTDAAGSGSYGTLSLFDFVEKALNFQGCRQNYTAFAEGSALTGGAGDAVFDIGIGSAPKSSAADGALGGATDDDIGGEIAITLSGGTGNGTLVTAGPVVVDGTGTAKKLNLNWSGTAGTIDASSYIDVTGTITVNVIDLGDD